MRQAAAWQWHDPPLAGRLRRSVVRSMNRIPLMCAGLVFALLASTVAAQVTGTKAMGTPKAGGKLLNREELRACLAQQKELGARRQALESERAQLDRQRAELQQVDAALKNERESIEKLAQSAAEFGKRSKALSAQTADFNERVARFETANLSGPTAERQRRSLDRERVELDKSAQALESERAALGPSAEQKAKAFDARLAARDQAASDWNARNTQLARSVQNFEVDLENWKIDCEGRSYREDDEKALQDGK
jgi:predicted  nucleic acid-binding Zn-ribbon protein